MASEIDYREQFISSISSKLAVVCENADYCNILQILVSELDKYELLERETGITVLDTSSDELLKMYAGTLLTEGKSKRTVYGYVRFLKRFVNDIKKPFINVGTFDIRSWLANMQQKVSMRSCENYRAYLSAFYTWLFKEGIIPSNPVERIQPVKYEDVERKSFSDIEIDNLRHTCTNLRNRAILEVLISTGMRVDELCGLDISDVNFTDKTIHIRHAKGGKQRTVYMTNICIHHLSKYLGSRDDDFIFLFVSRVHRRMTTDAIRNLFKTMSEVSGIDNVHPHRFRRTFATNLYKRGMDIRSIQLIMGHSDINTTMTYIAKNQDLLQSEFKKAA